MRISDWSSDVCSSDLLHGPAGEQRPVGGEAAGMPVAGGIESGPLGETGVHRTVALSTGWAAFPPETRSAERRVGKECVRMCRSRGSPHILKKIHTYIRLTLILL